jgi:hypothetical protein
MRRTLNMSEQTRIDRWRQRANELRAMARKMADKDARKTLLEIADEWERMADQLDQTLRGRTG